MTSFRYQHYRFTALSGSEPPIPFLLDDEIQHRTGNPLGLVENGRLIGDDEARCESDEERAIYPMTPTTPR